MTGVEGRAVRGPGVDCYEVVELVTDYIEGALPAALAAEVEAHLAECDPCRTYLAQMRRTIEEIGRVPVDSLSRQAQRDLVAAFRTFHPPTLDA